MRCGRGLRFLYLSLDLSVPAVEAAFALKASETSESEGEPRLVCVLRELRKSLAGEGSRVPPSCWRAMVYGR